MQRKESPKHIDTIREETRLINGFKFDIVATHLDSWSTIRVLSPVPVSIADLWPPIQIQVERFNNSPI